MQRQIVKHGIDVERLQVFDHSLALICRWKDQVKHVVCLFAVRGDDRESYLTIPRPSLKILIVVLPNVFPLCLNIITAFQLSEQKCRENIRRKIARSDIYPGVFVYLAAKEAAAIRTFLPDDFSSLDKFRIVDHQGPAFSTRKVLGFVEA